MHVLKTRDGLVVEHSLIEYAVHSAFCVTDDENEDLVYQLAQLLLEVYCSAYEPRIFFQVMEEQGSVADPEC